MSDAETKAAWDSAVYNQKRAEKAEARVAELEEKQAWINAVGPAQHPDDERYWVSAYIAQAQLRKAAEARVAELKYALENLFALVEGECPSLLENDHHWEMVRAALEGEGDE